MRFNHTTAPGKLLAAARSHRQESRCLACGEQRSISEAGLGLVSWGELRQLKIFGKKIYMCIYLCIYVCVNIYVHVYAFV